MKRIVLFLALSLAFASCQKDKKDGSELKAVDFQSKTFEKKTTLPCKGDICAEVKITVPEASNIPVVADSINKKIFNTVRGIVYFGEKPYNGKTYEEIMASFINSYEELKKEFPDETLGWEAKVDAKVDYTSDKVLNIKLHHYTYTGGAHGYEGNRSLLFNPETGKELTRKDFLKDEAGFKSFAEKEFRKKYKIPAGPINATGLMFENEVFDLPQTIFFTKNGLLLYYNTYEVASYADGPKELLLPYDQLTSYLLIK